MIMDAPFRRCIRIKAVHNTKHGRDVMIEDVETGEMITNIAKVVITLIPNELVIADFTYYEINETGHIVTLVGEPIMKHTTSSNIEIDLTAFERLQKERNT